MKKLIIAAGISVFATTCGAEDGHRRLEVIEGYVAHGMNAYNDQPLVDYSEVSPYVPWLHAEPKVKEIGVLDEGEDDASVITEETERSRPVATIRSFFDYFNEGGEVDDSLFNRPLDKVGTNYFGYTALDDRVLMVPFEDAIPGDVHAAKGVNARPTVGEWERISGQVQIRCRPDGTASAKVTIRDAFPNGLYTLWDVGVLNPLSEETEQGYAAPLGGVPNILLTDEDGCGYKEIEVAYCPTRACELGAESCSSYLSAFYHWDAQAYGGSPAATFAGAPTGVVASNQIVWPMSGTTLSDPQNEFRPSRAGCRVRFGRAHDRDVPEYEEDDDDEDDDREGRK